MNNSVFHKDFKARPYWWEEYTPQALPDIALPKDVRVAIVGAGYTGLSAALELARQGVDVLVLDAAEPGFGASTRNGGMVSGGVNVGKRYMSKPMSADQAAPFLNDAADAFSHIEN
jgi:NADPH-dependent 2,4-dienoyl-CoA reductase/sulfur reductase-like enzyme